MARKRDTRKIAEKIIGRILDEGLAESTWRWEHPDAFFALNVYREDLIQDAVRILDRDLISYRKKLIQNAVKILDEELNNDS